MITPGTILMGKDTLRPQCIQLEEDPYPNSWVPVKHDLSPHELEKELSPTDVERTILRLAERAQPTGIVNGHPPRAEEALGPKQSVVTWFQTKFIRTR